MLVRELIDRLAKSGMLDPEILDALRQQVEESGARVTPEAVVKLLVDNGHISRFMATKFISELRAEEYGNEPAAVSHESGELGLAEDQSAQVVDADVADGVAIIVDDDDAVAAVPIEDDEDVVEAVALDAVPVEDGMPVSRTAMADMAPHPVVPPTSGKKKKNVWDSIWIYGVAGLIVFLVGSGAALWYVLGSQSADDYVKKADEAYDNTSYADARDIYTDFLDNYPGDKSVSRARVRIGIASIQLAMDAVGDPNVGLEKALEILPTIENEEALTDHSDDISNMLMVIGEKLAAKADKQELADDKAKVLGQLDNWFKLLENPLYFGATTRKNFSPRILTVEETRARVVRAIAQERDLVKAVADMKTAIGSKETKQAFDIRSTLVRRYPRLGEHPDMKSLVLEASAIQKELVSAAKDLPRATDEALPETGQQSVLLTNLKGSSIPELQGRVIYVRARGSVLAVAADSGKILWRRYVGYQIDNPPVSLGDSIDDGVLLSDGRNGELQRVANNQIVWRSAIGETFAKPVVDGQTVYVTTESGRTIALDGRSGDAKWARQIPQTVSVGVGKQDRAPYLYVPGEHSNLYVLNAGNGECVQSFYLGHDLGTVSVPPVQLLGHLFVFENAGSDYCLVRILKVDESTGLVEIAQNDIRLVGNVVTSPVVQGRRLIVLTDLGQITVLDIEPTAERNKVSSVAEQVATYDKPTKTEMAVGRNEMWVTGNQLARYELQINTGKVVRDWARDQGDNYIAPPILIEGVLIHARQMRGTQGVRITAVNPRDAAMRWQNDVGVPVSALAPHAESRTVFVVTSQGALYQLDANSLTSGATLQPIENPGGDGVAMRYVNPLSADRGRLVLVNAETAKDLVVFDPSRPNEKLRLVKLAVPENAKTSAEAILIAGGVLLPMDNGRLMLLNWESGIELGSPFQPPTQPGQRVQWTTPVANPNEADQLLICDDSPTLFRLRVSEQIRELSQTKLGERLLGPAAANGSNWLAAAGGAAGDLLVTYNVDSLEETGRKMMGNRIVYGPVSVGDAVVLQTSDGKLHRISPTSEIQWSLALPSGQPAAAPLMVDGKMMITGQDGWIMMVDPTSGEIVGQVEVGQPVAGNPVVAGARLLVPGSEGIVFIVDRP